MATHPIDEAVIKIRTNPPQPAGAALRMPGPPRWLVLAHFACAAAAFWIFAAAFALRAQNLVGFEFQSRWALGLVHTLTLGWIAMTLLGSLLQMTSSHGGAPLYRPNLAIAGWGLLTSGVVTFVSLLWSGSDQYWIGAALAATGVACYLVVLTHTMLAAQTRDVTFRHFANALGYLAALAALGVLLALDRQRAIFTRDPDATLIAHVHMAVIGWVSISIAGASYRLVPAVSSYRAQVSRLPGRVMLALINLGLVGLAIDCLFAGRKLMWVWSIFLAAGFALYAWQVLAGPQPRLTASSSFTYIALLGGAAWSVLGAALSTGRLGPETNYRAAYIFAALVGWITPNILAQIHKIFPFLVWMALSKILPKEELPDWDRLGAPKLAWAEAAFLAASVPVGIGGFLLESPVALRISGTLLLAAATAYVIGALKAFSYLIHARLRDTGADIRCPL